MFDYADDSIIFQGISFIETIGILVPVFIILPITIFYLIIPKLNFRQKQRKKPPLRSKKNLFFKSIGLASILAASISLFNIYGNIVEAKKGNNTFSKLCHKAKTTTYKKIILDKIFLHTVSQPYYCEINELGRYSSYGKSSLPYPKLILDTNITFEINNKDNSNESTYKYYDIENYRHGVKSKILESKYAYIEEEVYNKNNIIGNLVKIVKSDDNTTISESNYYVSLSERKVCGDLYSTEEFGNKCLKPFYLVLDMLENTSKGK